MTKDAEIEFRPPRPSDARHLWQLVRESEALELNSAYAYLLLCTHFAPTSVVADQGGVVVGFVGAYRPPTRPDAVFVWQVGVDARLRGRHIASRLLHAVVRRDACRDVRFLEATVTPSNAASAALFRSLARDLDCPCVESEIFPADLFPGEGHEAENLFRIGPFRTVPSSERKDRTS